ncbi:type II toxin-antitoxin system RelE/ParE family toxin [Variovorax paradoxus]|nr:type II toxin-antitoxin system RelE/ParE family toxin [Variovorax paradoxus]
MRVKPVVPRELAKRDVEEAIDHYLSEGAERAALGLIGELERAYSHIGRHPGTGATRYAHELHLPGLRSWVLTRFPYLVFYIEQPDRIDVWRVLHSHRDIPARMQQSGFED